jgi:hypothetical protein
MDSVHAHIVWPPVPHPQMTNSVTRRARPMSYAVLYIAVFLRVCESVFSHPVSQEAFLGVVGSLDCDDAPALIRSKSSLLLQHAAREHCYQPLLPATVQCTPPTRGGVVTASTAAIAPNSRVCLCVCTAAP